MNHFLIHEGYLALVLLALLQACCVPIPSEVTVGFAGVLAARGRLDLADVILIATGGELVGSMLAYAFGRRGGPELVRRFGRFVLVSTHDLDRAERYFEQRGHFAVLIGRTVPFLRALVSVVAGASRMEFGRFVVSSAGGTLLYVSAVSSIGYGVGSAWNEVARDLSVAGYVVAAVVATGCVAVACARLRALREQEL